MTFLPHGSWHSVILLYFKNGTDNFVNTLKIFHIMVCFFMAFFILGGGYPWVQGSISFQKDYEIYVPLVVLIPFLLDGLILRDDTNSQV